MSDTVSSDLSAYTYYSTNSEIPARDTDISESELSSYVYYSTNSGIVAKSSYIPGSDITGNTESSNVNITDEERSNLETLREQNTPNSIALDNKVDAIIDAILN